MCVCVCVLDRYGIGIMLGTVCVCVCVLGLETLTTVSQHVVVEALQRDADLIGHGAVLLLWDVLKVHQHVDLR